MRPNTSTTQTIRWIGLELSADPAPPSAALDAESGRPGLRNGVATQLLPPCTVTIFIDANPAFLAIKMADSVPARGFLDALPRHTEIAPEIRTIEEFSALPDGLATNQRNACAILLDEAPNHYPRCTSREGFIRWTGVRQRILCTLAVQHRTHDRRRS